MDSDSDSHFVLMRIFVTVQCTFPIQWLCYILSSFHKILGGYPEISDERSVFLLYVVYYNILSEKKMECQCIEFPDLFFFVTFSVYS